MNYANPQTFNPEILYVFDPWNDDDWHGEFHSHDFLEISIILEGESNYHFDHQTTRLGAGRVLLFNPGVMHSESQSTGTYSHQLHIGLRNISLEGLPRNFFPNKTPLIDLGEYHCQFLEKAWQLAQEFNEQKSEYHLLGKGLVLELLGYLLRSLEEQQGNKVTTSLSTTAKRQQNLVNHTIYYLENHHNQEITLEQLADKLYVSPTHLSKVFKEETGLSPINYLIQIRLKHARELLKDDNLTVKEVAQAVGYQDAYHFSKLFKKYYGKAPSQLEK